MRGGGLGTGLTHGAIQVAQASPVKVPAIGLLHGLELLPSVTQLPAPPQTCCPLTGAIACRFFLQNKEKGGKETWSSQEAARTWRHFC